MESTDDLIERIQYDDINVRHFMLNFAVTTHKEFMDAMEAFANEVTPSFVKEWVGSAAVPDTDAGRLNRVDPNRALSCKNLSTERSDSSTSWWLCWTALDCS